jgi:hypothetical protein
MKKNKFISECGPFEVHSISQDGEGIRLTIYPAFPKYNISAKRQLEKDIDPSWAAEPRWAMHRYKGEGGGPGVFTAIALAREMEAFLNQNYSAESVEEWKALNKKALEKVHNARQKKFEKAMKKAGLAKEKTREEFAKAARMCSVHKVKEE